MKILLIHNRYLEPGGEDEVVLAEKRMLEHFGHSVVFYERENREIKQLGFLAKIRFLFKDIYDSKRTYNEVRSLVQREKPDIAHVHNTFFMISPAVYDACRDEGVAVVQTLHNYRLLCPVGTFYRQGRICEDCLKVGRKAAVLNRCRKESYFQSLILKGIVDRLHAQKVFFEKVSRCIVLSEFSRQIYVKNGFSKNYFSVKPNFIEFDPGISDKASEYGLFVGAFQEYKGIKTLLEAWKTLPGPFALKMIGDGPLFRETALKGQNSSIEYLGRKPLAEVLEILKKALFIVVPSECYENFPRVVAEAFACGVPVIASRIGVFPELIKDGETGLLFEPRNETDLRAKINTLLSDRASAQRMGQRARREYEEKYTLKENYEMLLDIYKSVMRSKDFNS